MASQNNTAHWQRSPSISLPAQWNHWREIQAYVGLTQEDNRLLHAARPWFVEHKQELNDAIVNALYAQPSLAVVAKRESSRQRLAEVVDFYLETLITPVIDEAYIATRLQIGRVHIRVQLPPEWVQATAIVIIQVLAKMLPSDADPQLGIVAIKRLLFDNIFIIGEYVRGMTQENQEYRDINEHSSESLQQIIREINHVATQQNTDSVNLAQSDTTILQTVDQLQKGLKGIQNISKFIVEVAEQSNLLGLNAAIEAARAGESGRGFSVVAEEIRKLAQRSRDSVKQINEALAVITNDSNNVKAQIQATLQIAENLTSSAETLNGLIARLSTSGNETSVSHTYAQRKSA